MLLGYWLLELLLLKLQNPGVTGRGAVAEVLGVTGGAKREGGGALVLALCGGP